VKPTAEIREVAEGTEAFGALLRSAAASGQAEYVTVRSSHHQASILLGAFAAGECAGFLRLLVQLIGSDEGRPPILRDGTPLREGFVEAFGVLPTWRRQGVGQQLQERAAELARQRGCYQVRSRSPVSSRETYALRLKMGYAVHPSNENDSYYFLKVLDRHKLAR
jgi:GNAT superfamily N-acetyltransferase